MKNPFGTKEYGGWGGQDPNEDGNMYNGKAKAIAARKVTACRKCKPKRGEYCEKHIAQSKTLFR